MQFIPENSFNKLYTFKMSYFTVKYFKDTSFVAKKNQNIKKLILVNYFGGIRII